MDISEFIHPILQNERVNDTRCLLDISYLTLFGNIGATNTRMFIPTPQTIELTPKHVF